MHVRALLACAVAVLLLGATSSAARPDALPTSALAMSLMPLPQSAFGPDAAGLKLDTDDMGVETNADRAADTDDSKDSAASFRAAGRITGYDLSYSDLTRLGSPGKFVIVGSRLELYAS